jgi:hypothetical protein
MNSVENPSSNSSTESLGENPEKQESTNSVEIPSPTSSAESLGENPEKEETTNSVETSGEPSTESLGENPEKEESTNSVENPPTNSVENLAPQQQQQPPAYPSLQMNLKPIDKPIQYIPVYCTKLGEYQASVYDFIISHLRTKSSKTTDAYGNERGMPDFKNMDTFGYTLLQQPIESLNIVFPNPEFDKQQQGSPQQLEDVQKQEIIKNTIGKKGLSQIMNYTVKTNPELNERTRGNFSYKDNTYGRIFSQPELPKYSSKIAKICDCIRNSKGIVLIHSQYIDGGIIPLALALEEMGFVRYSHSSQTKTLFDPKKLDATVEPLDALTMKPKSQIPPSSTFSPAKYVMITGDHSLSPNSSADIKYVTSKENKDGKNVKVILISKAGSEGLDFKNIRQVHILEPLYNMSRISQIVGRAVRNFSHCNLPFEERNVQIYLHASLPIKDEEPADLYIYRFAENKAIRIGQVTRLLKEISVDCVLNIGQTNFTMAKLAELAENQNIRLKLSSIEANNGQQKEIEYKIGDRPNTDACDYMNCNFTCSPNMAPISESQISKLSFDETFLKTNFGTISKRIRQLFLEQPFYKRDDLFSQLNIVKEYPVEQIDYALTRMISYPDEFIVDKYGRSGRLVNRGEYYAFQPLEITDEDASIYERTAPVDYKPRKLKLDVLKKEDVAKITTERRSMKERTVEVVEEDEAAVSAKSRSKKSKQISPVEISLEEEYHPLYEVLQENVKNALDDSTIKRIDSGETDWYKSFANVLSKLLEYHQIPRENIEKYTVYHYLDTLPFKDRYVYLRYLNDPQTVLTDKTEEMAKMYFEEKRIDNGNKPFKVFFLSLTEDKFQLIKQTNNSAEWTIVPVEENQEFVADISKRFMSIVQNRDKYNKIVGLMNPFKEDEMAFKMKDMDKREGTGVDCRVAGKGDIFKKLNSILPEPVYTKQFVRQEYAEQIKRPNGEVVTKRVDNGIYVRGLCVIMEILLRYFQDTNHQNRIWFLNTEETVLYVNVNRHKKLNVK